MPIRIVTRLTNDVLFRECRDICSNDRGTTAQLLVHLGEIDRRKLFRDAGFSSMFQCCIGEFLMSRDMAFKRIQAARAARKFPQILDGIIDGRWNVTTIVLLRRHLTRKNADRLMKAAEFRTIDEVKALIAQHFPRPDLLTRIEPVAARSAEQLVSKPVEVGLNSIELTSSDPTPPLLPSSAENLPKVEPLAPERFGLQVTISGNTHDKLRRAQELLGHRAAGDVAGVLDRALTLLVEKLEKQKCGTSDRPLKKQRPSQNPRHIPNAVRRAVSMRDGGRCTFVAGSGRRCEERSDLQFDHVVPVARGGQATVANIRLRCHAHNQLEAERMFGAAFMENKRESARGAVAGRGARAAASPPPEQSAAVAEVIPWLRGLGFKIAEASAAAALCANMEAEPLEKRVRVALGYFKRSRSQGAVSMA